MMRAGMRSHRRQKRRGSAPERTAGCYPFSQNLPVVLDEPQYSRSRLLTVHCSEQTVLRCQNLFSSRKPI